MYNDSPSFLQWIYRVIFYFDFTFYSCWRIDIFNCESVSAYRSERITSKNKLVKTSFTSPPIGLLTTVNERIDVVMVSKILGKIDNAVYGIAFKFALFSGFGLVILNQVLVPHYAKYFSSEENSKNFERKIKPNVRLSFALSSLLYYY